MSGKTESDKKYADKTLQKLKDQPKILMGYYQMLVRDQKSFTTIYNYICYIISFLNYTFDNNYDNNFFDYVEPNHIDEYINFLNKQNTSTSLKATHWSAINSLFGYLEKEYFISMNPVAETKRPTVEDNVEMIVLNENEIIGIFNTIETTADNQFRNRDKCMFGLLISTSIGVEELTQLDVKDVHIYHETIRIVKPNGEKKRYRISREMVELIKSWLLDREKYFHGGKTSAFFVSQVGSRLSYATFNKTIKKYAIRAINKNVTPQIIRDSAVVLMYKKTNDLMQCLKYLNTEDVSSLQRYILLLNKKANKTRHVFDDILFGDSYKKYVAQRNSGYTVDNNSQENKINPKLLEIDIRELNLHSRTIDYLYEMGIKTVGHIIGEGKTGFRRMRGIRLRDIEDIELELEDMGIDWCE